MLVGESREHFAIQLDLCLFELGDQFGVAGAGFFSGRADLGVPEAAEIALFLFTIGELMDPGVLDGFFGLAVFGRPRPHKTFGMLEQAFAAAIGLYSSFDACHSSKRLRCDVFARQKTLESLGVFLGGAFESMLAHTRFAAVFGVEMVLARLALEHLARAGDFDALDQGAVGFMKFGHGVQFLVSLCDPSEA